MADVEGRSQPGVTPRLAIAIGHDGGPAFSGAWIVIRFHGGRRHYKWTNALREAGFRYRCLPLK